MSELLSGFRLVKIPADQIFVTVNRRMMTFGAEAIHLLHDAEFVHAFINEETKQLAIQPCEKDSDAIRFAHTCGKQKQVIARWSGGDVHTQVKEFIPKDKLIDGVRIAGDFHPEENLIIFDFNTTYPIPDRTQRG